MQCEEKKLVKTTVQWCKCCPIIFYGTCTVPAVKTCLFQLRDFRIPKQKITVYWDEKQSVEQKHKHDGQVKKNLKRSKRNTDICQGMYECFKFGIVFYTALHIYITFYFCLSSCLCALLLAL